MQQYPADRLECVLAEVVLELARRWESSPGPTPRLSLVREPQRGVGPAKNRGAAAADGEVLVFLDADSTLEPTVARDVAAAWAGGARGGSIPVLADSDDFWERGFFHALEFGKRTFGIHGQMFYLDRRLFQPGRGPGPDAPGGRVPADGRQPVAASGRRVLHPHLAAAAAGDAVALRHDLDVRALVPGLRRDRPPLVPGRRAIPRGVAVVGSTGPRVGPPVAAAGAVQRRIAPPGPTRRAALVLVDVGWSLRPLAPAAAGQPDRHSWTATRPPEAPRTSRSAPRQPAGPAGPRSFGIEDLHPRSWPPARPSSRATSRCTTSPRSPSGPPRRRRAAHRCRRHPRRPRPQYRRPTCHMPTGRWRDPV